jgi:hypothetical protein
MTQVIERSEWASFLNAFTRMHEGWLVTIEQVLTPPGPSAVQARDLPLEEVSAGPDGTIAISVGQSPDEHVTHLIPRAAKLAVERTDAGIETGLCIDPGEGPSTRVSFRSAVRPEQVDGI